MPPDYQARRVLSIAHDALRAQADRNHRFGSVVSSGEIGGSTVNTTQEIFDRLGKLERSNRRLKTLFSICLCAGIAFFLMGAAAGPKVVEAEKFVLRDSSGVERGEIFGSDASRGIVFFNKNGERGLGLLVSDQMNGLIIMDQNGNLRESLTSKLDESNLTLYRPGSQSAQFEVTDNARGTALAVRDRSNSDRVALGVSDKGAALTLIDTAGANRAVVADGEINLATFSKGGELIWAPGWDKFSPEEQNRIKNIMRQSLK